MTSHEIAIRLHALRLRAGLSQGEAARRLDVSRNKIIRYENGTGVVRAQDLPDIARVYGFSYDELFVPETNWTDPIEDVNFVPVRESWYQVFSGRNKWVGEVFKTRTREWCFDVNQVGRKNGWRSWVDESRKKVIRQAMPKADE